MCGGAWRDDLTRVRMRECEGARERSVCKRERQRDALPVHQRSFMLVLHRNYKDNNNNIKIDNYVTVQLGLLRVKHARPET